LGSREHWKGQRVAVYRLEKSEVSLEVLLPNKDAR
jgi:hypothetical protein